MNTAKTFFHLLSGDELSIIFQMDATYHKVFSSNKFKEELRQKHNKLIHMKNMIQDLFSICDDRSAYEETENRIFYINKGNSYSKNDFKILILEEDIECTKFKIVFKDFQENKNNNDFDGFVCTKEQHENLFPEKCRFFRNHMHKVLEPFTIFGEKINGEYMDFVKADNDAQLYIHIKSQIAHPDFDPTLIEYYTELHESDPSNAFRTYDDLLIQEEVLYSQNQEEYEEDYYDPYDD